MKKLMMTLLAASLLMGVTPRAMAANKVREDKAEAARKAELRGDLARAHQEFAVAGAYYYAAIHAAGPNASLYNKLGIVQLQQNNRGAARKDFAQAVKLDPQLIPPVNNLARLP